MSSRGSAIPGTFNKGPRSHHSGQCGWPQIGPQVLPPATPATVACGSAAVSKGIKTDFKGYGCWGTPLFTRGRPLSWRGEIESIKRKRVSRSQVMGFLIVQVSLCVVWIFHHKKNPCGDVFVVVYCKHLTLLPRKILNPW